MRHGGRPALGYAPRMYRDDADAARLRIQTLEAKLAEQDAGRLARDAEIAELRAGLERLGREAGGEQKRRPRWPLVAVGSVVVLGAGAGVVLALRASVPPAIVCDIFVARLEACGDDPVTVAAYQQAAARMRESFKEAAQTPQGRTALATACTQALASLDSSGACHPKATAPR
jgi:hypothetical protein